MVQFVILLHAKSLKILSVSSILFSNSLWYCVHYDTSVCWHLFSFFFQWVFEQRVVGPDARRQTLVMASCLSVKKVGDAEAGRSIALRLQYLSIKTVPVSRIPLLPDPPVFPPNSTNNESHVLGCSPHKPSLFMRPRLMSVPA